MSMKSLPSDKLKEYEEVLLNEKKETQDIINQIYDYQKKSSKESSGDHSSFSLHQADQGTETDNREKEAYLLEREQEKLKALNLALKRVFDKTYGICEICGCYIPEPRLKILPYAKYCIECKSSEEKKNRRR